MGACVSHSRGGNGFSVLKESFTQPTLEAETGEGDQGHVGFVR